MTKKKTVRNQLTPEHVHDFVNELLGEDLHAMRVLSLANAVTGAIHAAALTVHAIGAALAMSNDLTRKHAVKQVDRMLSNLGIDVEKMFVPWASFVIGARKKLRVALDWTVFDKDKHVTLAAYLITDHGRATPLIWKTFSKATLKGMQNSYEDEVLELLHRCIPDDVAITIIADRGFGSAERYAHLELLGFDYIIRFRGGVKVTDVDGCTLQASEWVPPNGRAKRLNDATVTGAKASVPVIVCVKQKKMKEAWCLASNLKDLKTSEIVNLYGRRFTIEETFRDVKDQRFGMGLSATSIKSAARRDRLLFVAAMAHALLTLLGAAGEAVGLDRTLKTNTSKKRTLSLYRQGLFWYGALPNMGEAKLRKLMSAYANLLREQSMFTKVFGAI